MFTASSQSAVAQAWEPAAGCTGFLTVQMEGCFVANYWRCDAAPAGYVFTASHDENGRFSANILDAEFNWLHSLWSDGWRERLVHPAADPISTSTLMAQGWDAYDFELLSDGDSPDDGVTFTRVRGMDVLVGERVQIDGLDLERTYYHNVFSGPDGTVTSMGRGYQYFSPGYGLYFLGQEEWVENGEVDSWDNTPVEFVEPGEPGFGAIVPKYGCAAKPDLVPGKSAGPKQSK